MKFSRQYKINLIFTSIVVLILLGLYFYLNQRLTQFAYRRLKEDLVAKLALTRTLLDGRATQSPGAGYDGLADQIGRDLRLRVTIVAPDGRLWGDSEIEQADIGSIENHLYRPEIQAALEGGLGESLRFSTTLKKQMLYIGYPFQTSSGPGVVRLALPLSDIELISLNLRKLLVLALLLSFACAVIFGYGASFFISRPLKDMADVTRSIASGDFSRRVMVNSSDEIGDLGRLINNMAEQISGRMEEVVANKSRLEAVLLSMFDGVIVVDLKGCILLANDPLKEVLRLEGDPIGKRPLEVIRNIEIQQITDQILDLKSGFVTREISVLLEKEKQLLVHATPVIRDDQVEGAVLVFHDITDLRHLEKVRKEFVANVSHELRTPIASIKGYAETLLDGAIEDREHAREFLKIINTDAERLAQLISDLLDLAKIESGKLKLYFEECEVRSLVDNAFDSLKKLAGSQNIKIKNSVPPAFPTVRADKTCLSQAFYNLIENAIKYNHPQGWVEVTAEEHADEYVFVVSDSGVGIAPADLPRVFERFYRVDKARSRELGGTGLGLAIVKHVIQAHGGEVSAKSTSGQGASFRFSLPKI